MLDPNLTERIRSIFLHHEARVTVEGAAELLGVSREGMAAAIDGGDVETVDTDPLHSAFPRWPAGTALVTRGGTGGSMGRRSSLFHAVRGAGERARAGAGSA